MPILTVLALADLLDDGAGRSGWRHVPQLPFELAAVPPAWYRWLRLPVVSYALPALIAIGLVRHRQRPTRNPVARLVRGVFTARTLRQLGGAATEQRRVSGGDAAHQLRRHEPGGGRGNVASGRCAGYRLFWNAPPDRTGAGRSTPTSPRGSRRSASTRCRVVPTGRSAFRRKSGGLSSAGCSINSTAKGTSTPMPPPAAGHGPICPAAFRTPMTHQEHCSRYAHCRHRRLSAGMPARRSTPRRSTPHAPGSAGCSTSRTATAASLRFCRGWGALPFDRSSPDLTAHTIRAWNAWRPELPVALASRVERATARAVGYLEESQRPDGSWIPLWFGNQQAPDDANPVYGTARVLEGLATLDDSAAAARDRVTRGGLARRGSKPRRWLGRGTGCSPFNRRNRRRPQRARHLPSSRARLLDRRREPLRYRRCDRGRGPLADRRHRPWTPDPRHPHRPLLRPPLVQRGPLPVPVHSRRLRLCRRAASI